MSRSLGLYYLFRVEELMNHGDAGQNCGFLKAENGTLNEKQDEWIVKYIPLRINFQRMLQYPAYMPHQHASPEAMETFSNRMSEHTENSQPREAPHNVNDQVSYRPPDQ